MNESTVYSDNWLVNPDNVQAPILPGFLVKISNGRERFNVEVKSVNGLNITGYVMNKLLYSNTYNRNDMVTFEKKHVFLVLNHEQRREILEKASSIHGPILINYILKYKEIHGIFPSEENVVDFFENHLNLRAVRT